MNIIHDMSYNLETQTYAFESNFFFPTIEDRKLLNSMTGRIVTLNPRIHGREYRMNSHMYVDR